MSEQFTPGPWAPRRLPASDGLPEVWEIHWSEHGECVAEIVHGEGNARLVAEAPGLLEALEQCLDEMNPMPDHTHSERARQKAMKAVAKARGEQ